MHSRPLRTRPSSHSHPSMHTAGGQVPGPLVSAQVAGHAVVQVLYVDPSGQVGAVRFIER